MFTPHIQYFGKSCQLSFQNTSRIGLLLTSFPAVTCTQVSLDYYLNSDYCNNLITVSASISASFRLSRVTPVKIRLCQSSAPNPPMASSLTQCESPSVFSDPTHDGPHKLPDSQTSLLHGSHTDCLALFLILKTLSLLQGLGNLCSSPSNVLPSNICKSHSLATFRSFLMYNFLISTLSKITISLISLPPIVGFRYYSIYFTLLYGW